jgi:hypothetical protein
MVESGGATMVVSLAGGDGLLLLLKEMQPARASGSSRTIRATRIFGFLRVDGRRRSQKHIGGET